jgi:prepilin-type N-terminal cleavage/methylation domain-containing protein
MQRACRRERRRGEDGLSLLEVVVVMVIGTVLVAVAVPNFYKILARHQLDTAARHLAADIREARERAQTERAVHEVRFNKESDRYEIWRYAEGQGYQLVRRVTLPRQVDMFHAKFFAQSQSYVVRFNYFGEPSNGGNGAVGLKNRAGEELRYVIVSKTGRVRVSNEPPE